MLAVTLFAQHQIDSGGNLGVFGYCTYMQKHRAQHFQLSGLLNR